ncbi:uncharacterized protein LOC121654585 [Melanotaenia boesemani]|uniref:uncharacterized protein LOC121654585 n=1 Tax=Melanotaenia boesemani TaxID=1250792 RepID=UPI001C040434|nr:uncharacterized protein LOC121654585 [Melanotaenia boesemani]XP_041864736.1 uncharacterized protein LOC121654585 [Melanotaenia boesemani]XP_041864742.1 uncharacterized protein LOC121654585 [Melanotaenia boesemani]
MDQDREEGVPPSKTTQRNQPGPGLRPRPRPRPKPIPRLISGPGHEVKPKGEPKPSCVSIKSAQSRDDLIDFQQNHGSVKQMVQRLEHGSGPWHEVTTELKPSCVSMKSDQSKKRSVDFHQSPGHDRQFLQKLECGPGPKPGPVSSFVSMKSNQSKGDVIDFHRSRVSNRQGKQELQSSPDCHTLLRALDLDPLENHSTQDINQLLAKPTACLLALPATEHSHHLPVTPSSSSLSLDFKRPTGPGPCHSQSL